MLEKRHLLPASDLHRHCIQVEGIRRICAPNATPQVFAETADLEHLGKSRDHWSWVRLFFLSLFVVVYRMRSGDSESVAWARVGIGGWLEFLDEEGNKKWVAYPLSPFLEVWRQYVCAHRHPGTGDDSPLMPGGRNALSESVKSRFQRHSRRPLMWLPSGRRGAAAFVRLGGTVATLTAWARWHNQKQARQYAKDPPKWDFGDSIILPPRGSQRAHQRTLSSPQAEPKSYGRQTPGKDKLGPLSRVLNGIRWNVEKESPPRDPQQWTAIPLAPQSGMSPAQTADQTERLRLAQGRHRRVNNGQRRTAITTRPGESKTPVGESITPKQTALHSP